MKRIALIGAMDSEIDLLRKNMTEVHEEKIGKITFYLGKIENQEVILFRSGVGKVNAAVGTVLAIREFGAEKIIFTGVAGAISNELNILDIVISKNLAQHDFDLTGFGCPMGLIDGEESIYFEADEKLVELANLACSKVLTENKAVIGTIATGDQFIASKEKVKNIGETFGALACEMEGASVAQVAKSMDVPFVVIRAMSDKADGSAHMNYEEFKPVASSHSASIVVEILKNI